MYNGGTTAVIYQSSKGRSPASLCYKPFVHIADTSSRMMSWFVLYAEHDVLMFRREVLIRLHQRLDILGRIPIMHIIISQTVTD